MQCRTIQDDAGRDRRMRFEGRCVRNAIGCEVEISLMGGCVESNYSSNVSRTKGASDVNAGREESLELLSCRVVSGWWLDGIGK